MGSQIRQLRLSTGIEVPCFTHGEGDARPLMLLHAWGEASGCFDRLIPLLDGFKVIAPNLHDQGDTDRSAGVYSLVQQASDAAAVLDALEVPRAFVLGSSSGGYVAQQLALEHGQRVAALVLVGTPLSLQGRPPFADDVDRLRDPVSADWVLKSLAWFPLHQKVPSWFMKARIKDGAAIPAYVWKSTLLGLCSAVPPSEAGTIDAPTLILWGELDGLLSRTDQETLAARIAGSVVKTYPNVGHLVLWECPELVAADTVAFLAGFS